MNLLKIPKNQEFAKINGHYGFEEMRQFSQIMKRHAGKITNVQEKYEIDINVYITLSKYLLYKIKYKRIEILRKYLDASGRSAILYRGRIYQRNVSGTYFSKIKNNVEKLLLVNIYLMCEVDYDEIEIKYKKSLMDRAYDKYRTL